MCVSVSVCVCVCLCLCLCDGNRGHIHSKDATKVDGTLMMQNLAKGKLTVCVSVYECVCPC